MTDNFKQENNDLEVKKPIKKIIDNTKSKVSNIKNYNTNSKIKETGNFKTQKGQIKKPNTGAKIKTENQAPRTALTAAHNRNNPSVHRTPDSRHNKAVKAPAMKVVFLGGLNQIGKNITAFECGNDIIIVDCGMSFPDGEMLGIDLVIPDFSYLESNKERIRGLVVTHGHEDHIGAIPYLLSKINVPIYGTPLTIGLVSGKLKENRLLNGAKLTTCAFGQKIKLGCMEVEFIHVNHSIPDAAALAIKSPAGTIVHTGDFKIDCTPSRGEMIDLSRFAELGREGVLALMADSTNADRPGYTPTESKIDESFGMLFQKAKNKRIIIATFASNLGRIQQVINCAVKYGKKVAFSGRSMINYVTIAHQMKYLDAPDGIIIDIDLITKYEKNEVVLVTTGSQGEPMSALHRMAFSEHKKVDVGPEDFIIMSATPIPGNEKTVGAVVNELMKLGCEVIYESIYETHVSGHACQEELKLMQGIIKPKYFIPVHGERKHLAKHAGLAKMMGMPDKNVFVGDTGDVLEINQNHMKKTGTVPLELILVDGIGVGDVGSIVLRDRKHLGQDGLIVVVATLDSSDRHVIAGPDIVSRGFVYVRESEHLIEEARKLTLKVLESCADSKTRDWALMKTKVRDELYRLFHNRTRRNPVILPIIMEV